MQPEPKGIAQAFLVGEEFIAGEPVCLILGDNIFYGKLELDRIAGEFADGARVFGYPVTDPERYGVVEFDKSGKVLEHRGEAGPAQVPLRSPRPLPLRQQGGGDLPQDLKPSARGELEITDVNLDYLNAASCMVEKLGRGIAWLDTGTHMSLLEASHFIGTLEARQGLKIACLEEIAFRLGFIDNARLEQIIEATPKSSYREYLVRVLEDGN